MIVDDKHEDPTVAVHTETLEHIADQLEYITRWLTTAQPATIADLNSFPVPNSPRSTRLIEDLTTRTELLRDLAKNESRGDHRRVHHEPKR